MREYWANVYVYTHVETGKFADVGLPRPSWDEAEDMSRGAMPGPHNRYRIHVRLKPEGAPKRYRDAVERQKWEHYSGLEWTPDEIARIV